ncbi:MAG: hypothetical protein PSX36_01915 [bacterium]|nr:hypothetical protein [bacterium]
MLLIQTAYWWRFYELYFGSTSLVYSAPTPIAGFKNLAFILYNHTSPYLGALFIGAVVILCLLSLLLKKVYFIFNFMLWFLVVNIHNKIYPTLTGGNFLLNQFLLFNCFLSFHFESERGFMPSLKTALHNFSSLAIMLQICVAYFLSALAKLGDSSWLHGDAIAQVAMADHFSLNTSLAYHGSFAPFYVVLNYLILSYQLFFPVLVWIKPLKKPFLIFGMLMHLYISLVMGLLMFGIIMILGYIYFWPMKKPLS